MRIAVLGATGQIGSTVVNQLKADYPKATIIACSRRKLEGHFLFDPYQDNWTVLGELDVLVNCIGIIKETKSMSFHKAHVGLVESILSKREEMGNPKIIHISANGASSESPYPYFNTKGQAEDMLNQEPNCHILKPSVVCIPDGEMVKQLRRARTLGYFFLNILPFPAKHLKVRLQPILVEELAELVSELATRDEGPKSLIAVGGEEITVRQLMKTLNPWFIILPLPTAIFDRLIGIFGPLLGSIITPTQYQLLGMDNIGDAYAVANVLGRTPSNTISFWKKAFGRN